MARDPRRPMGGDLTNLTQQLSFTFEQDEMVSLQDNVGVRSRVPPSSPGNTVLLAPDSVLHRKISTTMDEFERCAPAATEDEPIEDLSQWKEDFKLIGLCLVLSLTLLLAFLYTFVFAPLDLEQRQALRIPTSLQAAQELGSMLTSYAQDYQGRLLAGHCACYVFLQTFAIPGTVFFNLLAGALFGMWIGFPLCLVYNTTGSVLMYLISKHLGRRLVLHYFPNRLLQLKTMMQDHRSEMVLYMTFLRIFPFTPNWFMNAASPHLNIPLKQFAPSVFFGLIPYNFLSCKAGLILSELRSKSDIIDTYTTMQLIAIAIIGFVFLPILKRRFNVQQ